MLTTLKVPKTGGIPTTKASVLRWLKSEGDAVHVGEPVVELETEKVSYELESPIAGVLLKIVAAENDQAPRHSSAAAVIAAEVAEKGFEHLSAPIVMVTALDASVPYSEPLENYLLPNEDKIADAVRSVVTERVRVRA